MFNCINATDKIKGNQGGGGGGYEKFNRIFFFFSFEKKFFRFFIAWERV